MFTAEVVDAATAEHDRAERRCRLLASTDAKLTHSFAEAGREVCSRLLPVRRRRDCPRAIKKPNRWPVLRTRVRGDTVQHGRWAHNPTAKQKSSRRAGRPALKATQALPPH
ncbi:hypothetical protein ACFYT4_26055 [Streptomyces sp. NPDC004609]|uniref:hypothetical protein n=1 Tax=Streptomyces sp. NPDC004609 TaxID=3364704 RepID=UPI0036B5AC19